MLITISAFAFCLLTVSACFAIETWSESRSRARGGAPDPSVEARAVENRRG